METSCYVHHKPFAFRCLRHPLYASHLRFATYKTAQVIQPLHSPIEEFGLVIDGCLKAEKYTVNGNGQCCAYFENNDVFPEYLYFTGKKEYTYTLIAVKKTEVAWMPASVFERMLEEDAEMMYSFMLYLSKRGMKNQMLLNCLHYQTIRERIAFWLLSVNMMKQGEWLPLPKSQTMWANTLHVSRSSLNQELKHMEKDGFFRIEGHALLLLKQQELEQLL